MKRAQQISNSISYHGEGPFWDAVNNRLLVMDVLAGAVVAVDSVGDVQRHKLPVPVATVIRRRSVGGFVIAAEREVILADENLTSFSTLCELGIDTTLRTNDGGCDSSGAFIIGTMSYDSSIGKGSVYRVNAEGHAQVLMTNVTISNGVQWSRDGKKVFYVDTPTRRVDFLNVDLSTGMWSGRECHIQVDENSGFPDGMAIDIEGGLWIALWGGGAVNHYDPSGRLVESIVVPGVSQVSSCAFGGPNNKTLFITTSRQGLSDDQEPDAGALFAIEVSTSGAPLFQFSGERSEPSS
jgi:sugar lactone lactonase YvrE